MTPSLDPEAEGLMGQDLGKKEDGWAGVSGAPGSVGESVCGQLCIQIMFQAQGASGNLGQNRDITQSSFV